MPSFTNDSTTKKKKGVSCTLSMDGVQPCVRITFKGVESETADSLDEEMTETMHTVLEIPEEKGGL
jgi:hypothetical protein